MLGTEYKIIFEEDEPRMPDPADPHRFAFYERDLLCGLLILTANNMSFSTAKMSLSSKLVPTVAHRPVRHTVRSRGALQVRNATLWSLQHKGKEIEITGEVGTKGVSTVGGKGATDQDKVSAALQTAPLRHALLITHPERFFPSRSDREQYSELFLYRAVFRRGQRP